VSILALGEPTPGGRLTYLLPLALLVLCAGVYAVCMYSLPPLYALAVLVMVGLCILTFINMLAGLIVMAACMLFSPEISLAAGAGRAITLRAEDLLLAVIFLAWLGRMAILRERRILPGSPVDKPLIAMTLVAAVATFQGVLIGTVRPTSGLFYNLKVVEFYLIFFLVANYVRTELQVKRLVAMMVVVGLAIAVHAMTQINSGSRLSAPFEGNPEPNTLGGYMVMLMGISLAFLVYAETKVQRAWWTAGCILILIPFIYTLSRTSYLALMGMVFFLAVFSRRRWLLYLLGVGLLAAPLILPQEVWERVAFTWQEKRYFGLESSAAERIWSCVKAFKLWRERPLLGVGVTGAGLLDVHYARVLSEMGLAGVAAFTWMNVSLFRMSRSVFRRGEGLHRSLALGFMAAHVGVLVHSLGAISFYIVRIMEPFWFLAGLVAVLFRLQAEVEYEGAPAGSMGRAESARAGSLGGAEETIVSRCQTSA